MVLDADHWMEVFQSLRRNRLRTILTACGVFWGVFMLVVMLGFGRGLEKAVLGDLGNWAQNVVFVWGERTGKPYKGRQPGREIRLTTDDVADLMARVDGIELISPRNHLSGRWGASLVSRKDKSESFGVTGDTPDYQRLETMILDEGRFLNPLDMAEHRKVAVIGARVREVLFAPDEPVIGQSIRVGSVDFTVVGVYRSPMGGARGDWINGRVFVPRTTFARTFAMGNRVDYMAVLVKPDSSGVEVERKVREVLKARHAIAPDDTRGIDGYNREKDFRKLQNLFLGISGLTWVVGILTLLAGAIGVSNIMMISVTERTREIGIRKAIGATPISIMSQIVAEATLLTAVSGYLGLMAGVGLLEVIGHIVDALPRTDGPRFFSRPELELGKALVAAFVLTLSGALAGLAPARSAVAVRPVEALAHE